FTDASFYPNIEMAVGPAGHLYIGKSDSLLIRGYGLDGKTKGVLQASYTPVRLTDAHIDSLLDQRSELFEKTARKVGFPTHWPAFKEFFIDDEGRAWVQLLEPQRSKQTWWVFNENGEPAWSFKLPTGTTLYAVQNKKAYGIAHTDEGFSSIVR